MGTGLEILRNRLRVASVALVMAFATSAALAAPTVQDIEFSSRPGSKFEVRLEFNETPPEFKTYAIEKPARIALDFPGAASALQQKRFSLPYGNASKAVVLESGDRTRLVLELVKLVPYETRVDGNNLFLVVGQEGTARSSALEHAAAAQRPEVDVDVAEFADESRQALGVVSVELIHVEHP